MARSKIETLEEGNVFFFYRPRVEQEAPEGTEDIQNFYMVLSPHGKKIFRSILIGRERLPDPKRSGKSRMWGFVTQVEEDPKALRDELRAFEYETKTRGSRHQPAARPAGEGIYRVIRHRGDHTHLVYALELPVETGEVQEQLVVAPEASYIATVANPERESPPRARLSKEQKADYPERLLERFEGRKFTNLDPPDFLDYEGAELVLVAASDDVQGELGVRLDTEDEDASSAEIFSDLRLRKSDQPLKPLFEGDWA